MKKREPDVITESTATEAVETPKPVRTPKVEAVVPFKGPAPKSLTPVTTRFAFKCVVTKPLLSTAHHPLLVVTIVGEPYEKQLPLAGRKEETAPTMLIDVRDEETGSLYALIMSALIKSAFDALSGALKGRTFAIRTGDIRAGKRYRDIEVVELEPVK